MNDRQPVVWFEGMTLDPHHFQQWDRYQSGQLNARIRALLRYDWGVSHLEIDRERLANGEAAVQRARGVLPDGYPFDIPDSDRAPAPRAVQDVFPATEESVGLFLVLPTERQVGSNVTLQNGHSRQETRFVAETALLPDTNTGGDERQVELARTNFALRFGFESLGSYTALQIARIVRSGAGFALDEAFVPPVLNIRASERLQTITRRTLELLVSRSGALWERRQSITVQRELSPGDVTSLQLLATLSTYIPLVNHHYGGPGCHPEELYRTLLALAGQLSASVANARVRPRDLPAYDHADLTGCFNALDEIVREMLGGAAPPQNYRSIPLTLQRENLYVARVESEALRRAQLFLVTRSGDLNETQLVADLPQMLRVASPANIDAVLRSYTRALTIEHTYRLPSGMPVDQQATYFELQKRGPFWEAIVESGALAIFLPREFGSIDLKLIAVEAPS